MPRYSGENWARVVQIEIGGSANVMIENCSIKEIDGEIHLMVNGNSQVVVYGGVFDRISVEGASDFLFLNGTIEKDLRFLGNSKVSLVNGVFRSGVGSVWSMYLNFPGYSGDFDVCGGVYYFNPTKFLDANIYKATQTKDAAGADIWVVTEK